MPQSRDRVYVVRWKKRNRAPDLDFNPRAWCWTCEREVAAAQAWKRPDRRHGRFRQQYVYACPTCAKPAAPFVWPAAAAIDWSLKGERIGDRRKPLAAATVARIRAGIERYRLTPAVLDTLHEPKLRPVDAPLATQTGRQARRSASLSSRTFAGRPPTRWPAAHGRSTARWGPSRRTATTTAWSRVRSRCT